MGQPANHKGFAEWNRLVNAASKEQYEFYYLGNSNIYHKDDDVKTIRVDYREKTSKTMAGTACRFKHRYCFSMVKNVKKHIAIHILRQHLQAVL